MFTQALKVLLKPYAGLGRHTSAMTEGNGSAVLIQVVKLHNMSPLKRNPSTYLQSSYTIALDASTDLDA